MTKAQLVYNETLNLVGSDEHIPAIQEALDREHAAADPVYAELLRIRQLLTPS